MLSLDMAGRLFRFLGSLLPSTRGEVAQLRSDLAVMRGHILNTGEGAARIEKELTLVLTKLEKLKPHQPNKQPPSRPLITRRGERWENEVDWDRIETVKADT